MSNRKIDTVRDLQILTENSAPETLGRGTWVRALQSRDPWNNNPSRTSGRTFEQVAG
jgi:hypothetical protein